MKVHGAPRQTLEGLGHEGGAGAGSSGQGAHRVLQAEAVGGGSQRVGVVQVDLQLGRTVLGGHALHGYVPCQPLGDGRQGRIELVGILQRVAADRAAERPCGRIEQEELDLHPDLGAVAQFGQAFDDPT